MIIENIGNSDSTTFMTGSDPDRDFSRAIVIVPVLKSSTKIKEENFSLRSDSARLDEAIGLAGAIDLDVVDTFIVKLNAIKPATLIGKGKLEEIKQKAEAEKVGLIIVDHSLSPVQQKNLESAWNTKVIDRTGLILEIFGRRASTREGVLQVDLAHLRYQKGRLVRSWTHLERQRGGAGFMGGPGETQIEADRRALQEKIKRLELEISQVRRTRTLHRAKRKKVPHPIVALVGYTNAGKSTLFNSLTGADVVAQDMLFATLDPTLRSMNLPHGRQVILSDTVGFISDLPTHLVAAFRATLEEVLEADLIIHVRDIYDPDNQAQSEDVMRIMKFLFDDAEQEQNTKTIEVWNKIDLLEPSVRQAIIEKANNTTNTIALSAVSGLGIEKFLAEVEVQLSGSAQNLNICLETHELKYINWVYENTLVNNRKDEESGAVSLGITITVHARKELEKKLKRKLKP